MAAKTNNLELREKEFLINQSLAQEHLNLTDDQIQIIKDKLPDKKYYEFAYHMLLKNKFGNLDQEWQSWKPWQIWNYPIYDLNRFDKIILQNKNYIKNRKILDVACNIGYLSLFCLNLDCEKVVGFDIYEEKLKIADFICQKIGSKKHEFKKININSQQELLSVSQDIDTILLSGVIYHVANHYEILKNLSNSNASVMIIENRDTHKFYNSFTPNIYWRYESTNDIMNGYSEKHDQILVGKPNQTWINMAMKELGWTLIKTDYIVMSDKEPRCCSVFER